MKFGQHMDVDDPKIDFDGQGQGHLVKKRHFRSHSTTLHVIFEVKGRMGQGQRSKVDLEGQRSRSPCQKCYFRSHLTALQVMFKVMG